MNNKFALSFGVSLVFVGFFNIWFETSNIVLFGLSVSALLFSIINAIVPRINRDKLEYLYVIPFVVLVSIFCYSNSLMKIDAIKEVVNGKITSIITFLSFGLIFISEFINHKKEISHQKEYVATSLIHIAENSNIILFLIGDYVEKLLKKGVPIDNEGRAFLERIEELSDEQMKLATIDYDLLSLDKENFTIEDVNDAFKKNSEVINYDKVSKKYNKRNKIAKEK